MPKYENIVFMQGDDADEPLRLLYDKHDDSVVWGWPDKKTEAIAYLAQWDNGDPGEVRDTSSAGSSDYQHTEGEYLLTWNLGLGYIGLERIKADDTG